MQKVELIISPVHNILLSLFQESPIYLFIHSFIHSFIHLLCMNFFIDVKLIYNIVLAQVYSVEIQYFIDSLKSYYKIIAIVLLSPFLTSKSPYRGNHYMLLNTFPLFKHSYVRCIIFVCM